MEQPPEDYALPSRDYLRTELAALQQEFRAFQESIAGGNECFCIDNPPPPLDPAADNGCDCNPCNCPTDRFPCHEGSEFNNGDRSSAGLRAALDRLWRVADAKRVELNAGGECGCTGRDRGGKPRDRLPQQPPREQNQEQNQERPQEQPRKRPREQNQGQNQEQPSEQFWDQLRVQAGLQTRGQPVGQPEDQPEGQPEDQPESRFATRRRDNMEQNQQALTELGVVAGAETIRRSAKAQSEKAQSGKVESKKVETVESESEEQSEEPSQEQAQQQSDDPPEGGPEDDTEGDTEGPAEEEQSGYDTTEGGTEEEQSGYDSEDQTGDQTTGNIFFVTPRGSRPLKRPREPDSESEGSTPSPLRDPTDPTLGLNFS